VIAMDDFVGVVVFVFAFAAAAFFALGTLIACLEAGSPPDAERQARRQLTEIQAIGDKARQDVRALGEESRALMGAIATQAIAPRGGGDGEA